MRGLEGLQAEQAPRRLRQYDLSVGRVGQPGIELGTHGGVDDLAFELSMGPVAPPEQTVQTETGAERRHRIQRYLVADTVHAIAVRRRDLDPDPPRLAGREQIIETGI